MARLTLTAEPLAASAVSAAAALLQTAYVLAETDEQVQAVSQIARPYDLSPPSAHILGIVRYYDDPHLGYEQWKAARV